jgi:hypothetical protein
MYLCGVADFVLEALQLSNLLSHGPDNLSKSLAPESIGKLPKNAEKCRNMPKYAEKCRKSRKMPSHQKALESCRKYSESFITGDHPFDSFHHWYLKTI